jgi:hypothetical protein
MRDCATRLWKIENWDLNPHKSFKKQTKMPKFSERLCTTVIMQWGPDLGLAMDAAEYRRRAWQCLAQTHLMATQEARTGIVALAATWRRLAEWAERKQQPQVQQQQQMQPRKSDNRDRS